MEQVYAGQSLFITGGTGFLAKVQPSPFLPPKHLCSRRNSLLKPAADCHREAAAMHTGYRQGINCSGRRHHDARLGTQPGGCNAAAGLRANLHPLCCHGAVRRAAGSGRRDELPGGAPRGEVRAELPEESLPSARVDGVCEQQPAGCQDQRGAVPAGL
ncbi:hypothetical protein ON010_g17856 [Phytophthora cinnamomi]|nr:hypothetical protein ON010_g17856 [Phytophthora cinnamomi]